jgi:hypothetical protein
MHVPRLSQRDDALLHQISRSSGGGGIAVAVASAASGGFAAHHGRRNPEI